MLIDNDGNNKGVKDTKEAIKEARAKGFDLVLVAPDAKPPVCKIMDYGKYLYRENKKHKKERQRQKHTLKEMKFYPKIEAHDYETKLRHIKRFLSEHNPVRIQIWMRGREKVHPELAQILAKRIIKDTETISKLQGELKPINHRVQFQLMPIGGNYAQTENQRISQKEIQEIEER
jgi:translation initiation factor IF-3